MTNQYFEGEDLEVRVRQLEEGLASLRATAALERLPLGGLRDTKSHLGLRSIGGDYGGAYPAGMLQTTVAPSTDNLTADYLFAIPFYLPGTPNTVTKIGIRVTTGAESDIRLGLYADKGEARLFPGKLLLDAGEVDVSATGVKSLTVNFGLPRGLIWVAILGDAPEAHIAAFAAGAPAWALLGYSEDGTARYTKFAVSQAYSALPDPFPATADENSGRVPYVFLKFG